MYYVFLVLMGNLPINEQKRKSSKLGFGNIGGMGEDLGREEGEETIARM